MTSSKPSILAVVGFNASVIVSPTSNLKSFSGFSEMQKVFQQGLVGRMSEYPKRVQNLNLEISQQEDGIQSNLGYFIQDGIQALQSLGKTVTEKSS